VGSRFRKGIGDRGSGIVKRWRRRVRPPNGDDAAFALSPIPYSPSPDHSASDLEVTGRG
jgi:hypothetical protein